MKKAESDKNARTADPKAEQNHDHELVVKLDIKQRKVSTFVDKDKLQKTKNTDSVMMLTSTTSTAVEKKREEERDEQPA